MLSDSSLTRVFNVDQNMPIQPVMNGTHQLTSAFLAAWSASWPPGKPCLCYVLVPQSRTGVVILGKAAFEPPLFVPSSDRHLAIVFGAVFRWDCSVSEFWLPTWLR